MLPSPSLLLKYHYLMSPFLKESDSSYRISSSFFYILILFPNLPVSFLDFCIWAHLFCLLYGLPCFQCFLTHCLVYWVLQLQNFGLVFYRVFISSVKHSFWSLMLFLNSLNCLSEFSRSSLSFFMTAISYSVSFRSQHPVTLFHFWKIVILFSRYTVTRIIPSVWWGVLLSAHLK